MPKKKESRLTNILNHCSKCNKKGEYIEWGFANTLGKCGKCEELFCAQCAQRHYRNCPKQFPKGFR